MQTMIFISRHNPTPSQVAAAARKGYTLIHVGDVDAFPSGPIRTTEDQLKDPGNRIKALVAQHQATAVACVHPWLALLATHVHPDIKHVGVFCNVNRAPEGAPPQFECGGLYLHKTAHHLTWCPDTETYR